MFGQSKFNSILNFEDLIDEGKRKRDIFMDEDSHSFGSDHGFVKKRKLSPSKLLDIKEKNLDQDSGFIQKLETPIKTPKNKKQKKNSDSSKTDLSIFRRDKNSKGLRYLSKKVKEIVFREKQSTYKNVAEILIHSLANQDGLRVMKNVPFIIMESLMKSRILRGVYMMH